MKRNKRNDRLKPISLHGHKPEDVLRAFMQVKPERKEGKKSQEKDKKDK